MDAERLMRFTVVLVVLALVALIVVHETERPTPKPVANLDWLELPEESVIEIGVPPETVRQPPHDPLPPLEVSYEPPQQGESLLDPPRSPDSEFTREVLRQARAEGRAEARRAAELGNPTLMAGGYREVGYPPTDPATGLPVRTIGDDLDPYQVAFADAYNREIHRLFADVGPPDRPGLRLQTEREKLRRLVDTQAGRIDALETEIWEIRAREHKRYVDRRADEEPFDGLVRSAFESTVILELSKRKHGLFEGTRLMVWSGSQRIALIQTEPNSRVCRVLRQFGPTEVDDGMFVSSPFFECGRSLAVALEYPEETTDVAAIRDRLMMIGARLVSRVAEADVVIRLNDDLTPIPGKLVVGSKALYTFLALKP